MAKSYFFYDLETSGISGRSDRIMQFAGMRTDENLKVIGEPYNLLVRLNDDVLPSPEALMVTGITPQKTVEEGYTEAEFAKIFIEEICIPDTIIVGFNNVRFDDEFIRALLWRNYYDPYEWAYQDGRSRWDLLDVVRLVRALRPEGINWPVVDGKPTNRLELLSKENNLEHTHAHDALSDVEALIGVAKLIREKQPEMYDYLLKMRDKKAVQQLVNLDEPKPFVYASGRYDAQWNKTTVALPITPAEHGNVYVYDLRYDTSRWNAMSDEELQAYIATPYAERGDDYVPFPIKKLQYNRVPAVAPLGVLEAHDGWAKIGLTLDQIEANRRDVHGQKAFIERAVRVLGAREASFAKKDQKPIAEAALYDGFLKSPRDKLRCEVVRNASVDDLKKLTPEFDDQRLIDMFPRYKVRNFPQIASDTDRAEYEAYRKAQLQRQLPSFSSSFERVSARDELSAQQQFVLEELKLWVEAILPSGGEADVENDEFFAE